MATAGEEAPAEKDEAPKMSRLSTQRMSLDGSTEFTLPEMSPREEGDGSESEDDKEDKEEEGDEDKESAGGQSSNKSSSPKEKQRGPVWMRLYEDHKIRKDRLNEKREMLRLEEDQIILERQRQVLEDIRWVEVERVKHSKPEDLPEVEDIERRISDSKPWFERLHENAKDRAERLRELQDKFNQEDEAALQEVIRKQHEDRAQMCEIFLQDRDDAGLPWHERLYNEAQERYGRAEAREIAAMDHVLMLANMGERRQKSVADEEGGEEHEDDSNVLWHERLHAEHARRMAALTLRRVQEAKEEMEKFKEEAEKLRNKDGPVIERGEDEKKHHDRLHEDAETRQKALEKARNDHTKQLQEYMDIHMARWMTETKKSRECWPTPAGHNGKWFTRLHANCEEKAKAVSVERQRKRFQEEKELEAGKNYLHQMVAGNQKNVSAKLTGPDPYERLYIHAKDLWERREENKEYQLAHDTPTFKPTLVSKSFEEVVTQNHKPEEAKEKVDERGTPDTLGERLHKLHRLKLDNFQEQFLANGEAQEKYCKDAQEERIQQIQERVKKVAPALLEDTTPPWERLHYIPKHWLVEPQESPRKTLATLTSDR